MKTAALFSFRYDAERISIAIVLTSGFFSHDSGGRNIFEVADITFSNRTGLGNEIKTCSLSILCGHPFRGLGSHFIRNPMASAMGYARSPLFGAESSLGDRPYSGLNLRWKIAQKLHRD